MSGIIGGACFVRGWGFELRGISGGVRVVHVGGELEMSGVGAFLKLGETCLAKRGASFTGQT